jgi:[ribosomal protein S18]-alanine N-acetyltransferase
MKHLAENAQIRKMTAADVARVLEIAVTLPELPRWPEAAYLGALNPESTPRRVALVATGSDLAGSSQVEGFTVASLLPPQAELESIAVAAGSQRRGLGRMLFDTLVNELRAAGAIEINLEVRASNHAALAFYRRAGFGQTGLRRAYYADPVEDAVLMRLDLS